MTQSTAIIVLTWNGWSDTERCLRSLQEHVPEAHVIVVDNASEDGTPARVEQQFPQVRVVRNVTNLGYTGGNNRGLRIALAEQFDVIGVLNNDTEVPRGFLEHIVAALSDPAIGAVSPVIRYRDHEGVWFQGMCRHERWGIPVHTPYLCGDPTTLTGCCLFARRDIWERVGLFDERFFLVFEDADWSRRVRAAGLRLGIVTSVAITHAVSASFERSTTSWGDYYFIRNALLYLWIHGGAKKRRRMLMFVWDNVFRDAVRNRRARDRSGAARMRLRGLRAFLTARWGRATLPGEARSSSSGRATRVAMISYYLPSESKIGAGAQAHHLANELVRAGQDVVMFSPCRKPTDALYDLHRVELGGAFRILKFALALRRQEWGAFDVIHAHGDDYLIKHGGPPRVRTMHGSCLAEAVHIRGLRARCRMAGLGCSEWLASLRADETVAVSRNTTRWMPWVHRVIPNGIELCRFASNSNRSAYPSILFVGTYGNRKRGWLLYKAFQEEVRKALPHAQLWMVCSDAPPGDGVTVFGYLSDEELSDLYGQAWVFCLPSSYEGFGIPYVEALAAGVPVVASPNVGAREILENGRFGELAPDGELGDVLCRLLVNEERRGELRRIGIVRARVFDLEGVGKAYIDLYRQLIRSRMKASQ